MTSKNKKRSLMYLWLVIALVVLAGILIYPSVFRVTRSEAYQHSNKAVATYQKAITQCIQSQRDSLVNCSSGQSGIPESSSSWFNSIKSIRAYNGVIQVKLKLHYGQTVYLYYIPRALGRRWLNSSTQPSHSVSWQRVESHYCGLDNKEYNCAKFQ